MKRNLGLVMSAALFAAFGCGSVAETADPGADVADAGPPILSTVEQISIDEISIYQATKVSLVTDGEVATPNAPIIAARPALIRVYVKPTTSNSKVPVSGELRIKRAGKDDFVLRASQKKLTRLKNDADLASTLNFEIPADVMTDDAAFSFKVGADAAALDGGEILAFPAADAAMPLGAKTGSQKLRVTLVPVSYESDGSSRVPDLADVSLYKNALYKMYPTANVEITVRTPMKWGFEVMANGDGWGELLDGVMQLRRADKVDPGVYYVGVFNPSDSLGQFCSDGGCVLGIAPSSDGSEVGLRVALVLGYKNRQAGGTLAQELAHAMGRLHAPCGSPQAIDKKYPYEDGSIGHVGYDILDKTLIDPNEGYADFMSYCSPVWTSDYTFKNIYDRMEIVQKQVADLANTGTQPGGGSNAGQMGQSGASARTHEMLTLRVARDGSVKAGAVIDVLDTETTPNSPSLAGVVGETMPVIFEGPNGRPVETAVGRVRALSSTGARLVLVPKPASPSNVSVVRARVGDFGAVDIRAALRR